MEEAKALLRLIRRQATVLAHARLQKMQPPIGRDTLQSEVYKVPEPANLVRRKYLKISFLAENVDQNPRVENTEIFLSNVFCILTENLLYTLFS
jgi:hypothetical protein